MITFEDWLSALTSSQEGRIVWANYQYDLKKHNLESSVYDDFKSAVEKRLADSSPPVQLFDAIVNGEPDKFDLKCSRRLLRTEAYSRVIEVTDFAIYNLRLEELGLELDEEIGRRVWDKLGVTITSYYHGGTMKTRRNFFWCLPTHRLDLIHATTSPAQEASVVRNKLGLYHIDKNQRLLRIDIPPDVLSGKRVCAPTSLDAGINIVFAPCDDTRGVGWALDLETLSKSVEELIIEALTFTADYTVVKIGIVSEVVPTLNMNTLEANAVGR
ncbi:MAG TPA: hypothetical protein VKB02_09570 [Pyrinomonadaceae bacterium]|nr:hypothetical protein [Pyrinomonadaceae bacterium]